MRELIEHCLFEWLYSNVDSATRFLSYHGFLRDSFTDLINYVSFCGTKNTDFSIAIGSNLYLLTRSGYLVLLVFSVFAAVWPTSIAEWLIKLSAKVFMHVASQQSTLSWLKGKIVMPSGRLPSPRLIHTGTSTKGNPDAFCPQQIISFIAACLGCLPSLKWQDNRWKPYSSAFFPHLHRCFSQIFEPVLKAIAILVTYQFWK